MNRLYTGLVIGMAILAVGCGGGGSGPKDPGQPDTPTDTGIDGPVSDVPTDVPVDGTDTPPVDVHEVQTDPGTPDIPDVQTDQGTPKCTKDEDCKDPGDLEKCQKPVCVAGTGLCGKGWDSTCCLDKVIVEEGFETGLPQGWAVDDGQPSDPVTWSVIDAPKDRPVFGKKLLYLGDPKCLTYFSGQLTADCKPAEGAQPGLVRASITTSTFSLPGTQGTMLATMYVRVDAEPNKPEYPVQPDQFRVQVVNKTSLDEVFSSKDIGNTTGGKLVMISVNLTSYAGKDIALKLSFDTLDDFNNFFEGIYVDQFKVFTSCDVKTCATGSACDNDAQDCTDDKCVAYANQKTKGFCAYPVDPFCQEPVCHEATVKTDCPSDDPCKVPSCVGGQCVFTTDPKCCKVETKVASDFEGGLGDFSIKAYKDDATVRWQITDLAAANGKYSLYYGNVVTKYYDSKDRNWGEATTGEFDVPATGWTFLSFNLNLSTEFDNTVPELYYNPMGVDLFEVKIVEKVTGGKEAETLVWSSNNILGTTSGKFLPVGVDLTGFNGKTVRVRLRFDTQDDAGNEFGGVYVDDFKVAWDTCNARNCMGPYDCGIDGVCRTGSCTEQNLCDVIEVGVPPDCCAGQKDCDDADPCTTDGCVEHKCIHDFTEGPGCCKASTLATWAFDAGGTEDFLFKDDGTNVKWQVFQTLSHSAPGALYFGNGANYDNGAVASGTAVSPEIQLPPQGVVRLGFFLYMDVEKDLTKDLFDVEVIVGETPTSIFTKTNVSPDTFKTWFQVTGLDLSPYLGKAIRIRFSFTSIDQIDNSGLGVAVDDVVIEKACPL